VSIRLLDELKSILRFFEIAEYWKLRKRIRKSPKIILRQLTIPPLAFALRGILLPVAFFLAVTTVVELAKPLPGAAERKVEEQRKKDETEQEDSAAQGFTKGQLLYDVSRTFVRDRMRHLKEDVIEENYLNKLQPFGVTVQLALSAALFGLLMRWKYPTAPHARRVPDAYLYIGTSSTFFPSAAISAIVQTNRLLDKFGYNFDSMMVLLIPGGVWYWMSLWRARHAVSQVVGISTEPQTKSRDPAVGFLLVLASLLSGVATGLACTAAAIHYAGETLGPD
jgi:hypothetical protein